MKDKVTIEIGEKAATDAFMDFLVDLGSDYIFNPEKYEKKIPNQMTVTELDNAINDLNLPICSK